MRKAWHKGNGELIPSTETDRDWKLDDFEGDEIALEIDSKQRAFQSGNQGAALDALILCCRFERPLPEWLGLALIKAYKDLLQETPQGRKWLRRYRQDLVDFERVEALQEARARGFKWSPGPNEISVYDAAAKVLRGTSPAAVRKSFQRFKRTSKETPFRYHVLSSIVLGASNHPEAKAPQVGKERLSHRRSLPRR